MANRPEPDANIDPSRLSWAVRRSQRAYDDLNVALARRMQLSLTDLSALDVLTEGDATGPVELGRRLGMTSASSTALVDRLEQAGHVQRVRHPDDRRRVTIEVTDHAHTEIWEHIRPIAESLDGIAAALSDEQRATVLGYLEAVAAALDRHARGDDHP